MILIKVDKLIDIRIAKKAARYFRCKLYRTLPNAQQFETSSSNLISARHLIEFFSEQGYSVSKKVINKR
jgi:hypothetical protein